ncbi:hypothetical protein [Bradyrhizobium commune]|uniref:Uncharacterized protein n=1 Tax=Bradyrhizobium commune TaxID=83627 RepID=A0A7S9DAV3_9BRAD|nr:hypothetical protein [Bradyrhizobium commune]QPF94218.1 hypothetical protein IC761_13460 [Bradyrhizobium commune]
MPSWELFCRGGLFQTGAINFRSGGGNELTHIMVKTRCTSLAQRFAVMVDPLMIMERTQLDASWEACLSRQQGEKHG